MAKTCGFPSDLAMARNTDSTDDGYQIVAKKRGDCIVGYKVKQYGSFRGAMVYTIEAAREFREFLRRTDGSDSVSFDVIE